MNAIQELLKDFEKIDFNVFPDPNNTREQNIQQFMNENPTLFKWYFEEKGGTHSQNLIQSDIDNAYTTTLRLTDMIPGTKIRLVFAADGSFDSYHKDIIIGATGNYYADGLNPIYGIYLIKDPNNTTEYPVSTSGVVSYQYKVPVRTSFNSIINTEVSVGKYYQFVGEVEDLVESLTTTRDSLTKICMSRYFKRPIEYLFYEGETLSYKEDAYKSNNADYRELVDEYKDKLFWDLDNYEWEDDVLKFIDIFDEKEHLGYSPFSIYVLRNSIGYNREDIREHLFEAFSKSESEEYEAPDEIHHRIDHMFEKYYIDRYLRAQTAEEMLTEYMAIYERIAAGGEEEEVTAWQEAVETYPLYVFDPWIGKVYKVGSNYKYDSNIYYNGEPIDLREIQRYDLDNLEPEESLITVGNGVYGDIFYQNVTTLYSFENSTQEFYEENNEGVKINIGSLKAAKEAYLTEADRLKIKKWSGTDDISRAEENNLNELYDNYNHLLELAIDNWIKPEE